MVRAAGRTALTYLKQYRLLIVLTAIGVILWFASPPFPRIAALKDADSLASFLSATALTLSGIVGIVVAVALVALELLRSTYAAHAIREVFRSTSLRELLTIYLFTIGLALFTLGLVGQSVPPRAIGLTYYTAILGLVCLATLYPAVRGILGSTRPDQERITEIASELDRRTVRRVQHFRRRSLAEQLELRDSHPLFVLRELSVKSMAEGDSTVPTRAIMAVGRRLAGTIEPEFQAPRGGNSRDLLQAFLLYLRPVGAAAVAVHDETVLETLFSLVEAVQDLGARSEVPWYCLIEFNEWMEELCADVARQGLDSAFTTAVWCVQETLKGHLTKNMPAEEDVLLFAEDVTELEDNDPDATNQWDQLSMRHLRIPARCSSVAIEEGNRGISSSAIQSYSRIKDLVAGVDALGEGQKNQLIVHCYLNTLQQLERYADAFGTIPILGLSAFGHLSTVRALNENSRWAKSSLEYCCRTIHRLAQREVLSRHTLNELGSIGRACVEHVEDDRRFGEALILIAITFRLIAEDLRVSDHVDADDWIRSAEEQLRSLKRWFESKEVGHPEVEKKIEDAIDSVGQVVRERGISTENKIAWPSLQDCQSDG